MGDTRTSKKFEPFLAHSELTNFIYIIDEDANKYEVTKQCIEAMEATSRLPKWVSVSEKLPKVGETVLCQCQANIYEVLKLTVDGWYHDKNHCYMLGFVIAWQPLPQPYERKKGVLEKINEKQDSLLVAIKAWDDEINKNGYVN